ncbi:MAG: hypothetical protein B6I30_08890 [Desulfobacteraceae bacterium 4572_187]|nr:MAG: hypothetical protein B6I30_08890 [Desulfobacteraceae bacterium 4572_187]
MAKKGNICTAQNEKAKFSHTIRKAVRILKPLHLDYNQTKYVFKEIRKALNVRDERKPSRIVESLSIAEVELLINTAYKFKGHIGLAVKILFMTGARNDEFVNIEIGDVLIDECFIHIRHAKDGEHAHRHIPILPTLAQEMISQIMTIFEYSQ